MKVSNRTHINKQWKFPNLAFRDTFSNFLFFTIIIYLIIMTGLVLYGAIAHFPFAFSLLAVSIFLVFFIGFAAGPGEAFAKEYTDPRAYKNPNAPKDFKQGVIFYGIFVLFMLIGILYNKTVPKEFKGIPITSISTSDIHGVKDNFTIKFFNNNKLVFVKNFSTAEERDKNLYSMITNNQIKDNIEINFIESVNGIEIISNRIYAKDTK